MPNCWPNQTTPGVKRGASLQRLAFVFASVLLLTSLLGCASRSFSGMAQEVERWRTEALATIDVEECQANGGAVRGVCMFGIPACVIPYSDAGKACSDSSECEGLCWIENWGMAQGTVATGHCTSNAQDCLCGVEVLNGKVDGGFCAD
jgi:hypothetical protein